MLFDNPEFVRNARIQLRRGRLIAAVIVCLAISGTIWASIMHADVDASIGNLHKAAAVFAFTLYAQVAILLIGGGIFVLQSVHREMEHNTFDFQRVTRLSSFELAIGKLFGAPVGAYFVTLCFVPLALAGAIGEHVPARIVAEAYVIVILGSVAFHSLALIISVIEGRGAGVIGILLYLAVLGATFVEPAVWSIRRVSPFAAADLLGTLPKGYPWRDEFFGVALPHFAVLVALYLALTGWFLLAVVRNLKRERALYEIYAGPQMLAFALFASLLQLGFYSWKWTFFEGLIKLTAIGVRATIQRHAPPFQTVEQFHLRWTVALMAVLGLLLLRNREKIRKRAQNLGERATSLWTAAWPATYVVAGVAIVGASLVSLIAHYRYAGEAWSLALAVYDVVFVGVWLARDTLCIQWLALRRARRPLASAALYFLIFYGCTATIFSALNLYAHAHGAALTAILIPSPLFALNFANWIAGQRLWIFALAAQCLEACLFWWLHRQRLQEFEPEITPQEAPKEMRVANA